jgi:hypothetical protein
LLTWKVGVFMGLETERNNELDSGLKLRELSPLGLGPT